MKLIYHIQLTDPPRITRNVRNITACGLDIKVGSETHAEKVLVLERIRDKDWFMRNATICPECDEKRDVLLLKEIVLE